MTAVLSPTQDSLAAAIDSACRRIAPTWPLDRFIAVNPFWGHVERPISEVAAEHATLDGARVLMRRSYFAEQWRSGRLRREHLADAIRAANADESVQDLVAALDESGYEPRRLPLWTDVADGVRFRDEPQLWSDVVKHQISQHAAAYFDRVQSAWSLPRDSGLFGSWREWLASDRGLPRRSSRAAFEARVRALPASGLACIELVIGELGLEGDDRTTYFTALLGDIRGWGAWCAYERWQAELEGSSDDHIVDLLAIRMAWEYLIVQDLDLADRTPEWRERIREQGHACRRAAQSQRVDWLLQHALEIAFQEPIVDGLRRERPSTEGRLRSAAQAVFCIDVRSERFRRALESVSENAVETRGFAGFFGVPVEFAPIGAEAARPQLPGLLAPAHRVSESTLDSRQDRDITAQRHTNLRRRGIWERFSAASSSMFTFVESMGLLYLWKLVSNSIVGTTRPARAEDAGVTDDHAERLRPTWPKLSSTNWTERIDLAENVLRSMGIVNSFARLVLLVGHGSSTTNNPHAAGLDCGACGGQTGEVNARLLAQLLEKPEVRRGLRARGIRIPRDTYFVAGLHDTTTDELRLFDVELPESHRVEMRDLQRWLAAAGDVTRVERAPSLGLGALRDDLAGLHDAMRQRTADWAQVRPEWGLADNAAFVVAPRWRTRGMDLDGRVFLHDYDHRLDVDDATLTLIMTAPMVVTNWINMQYYASTVDNRVFGSGNKVLHNVVGGDLGVFEGNGGDLRIGLAMQSLHDGEQWRHTPLRLSVFIEAPEDSIDGVIERHENVRHLVDNGWLHLFRIDDAGTVYERAAGGDWHERR